MFGEGDNVMPTQIESAKAGRGRLQIGDNTNLCDWCYTPSAAYAHVLTAQALLKVNPTKPPCPEDEDMRVDGEAFVITNDEPWPFWKFVRTIGSTAGYPTRDEDVWVLPPWLSYTIAVAAEWVEWASSFGQRESHLNRFMMKYMKMTRTFDITKAKKRLGYRPQVNVEEGIRRAVDAHICNHPVESTKGSSELEADCHLFQ